MPAERPPTRTALFPAAARSREIARGRELIAGRSLEDTGRVVDGPMTGIEVSLRWVLLHLIEEYARRNGHADILRERIDGATGV